MTNKQKQLLLMYLNYYTGKIDGIWGPRSKEAAEQFQLSFGGLTADGDVGPETQRALKQAVAQDRFKEEKKWDFWKEIRHWDREEFRCRCGGKYCDGFPKEPQEELVRLAEDVREHFGKPGIASSGLRCSIWNRLQGGVSNSRHLLGKALDLRIVGCSSAEVLEYINKHSSTRYAYDIDGTYVHVDVQ